MGGEIGVISEIDQGSHFWVTIALHPAPIADIKSVNNCHVKKQRLNILIVEDEDINAMVLQNFLQNLGHHSQRVHNGYSALNELRKKSYDMIFMDMEMPEMSGPETTRNWRKNEASEQHIPIIALTAHATTEDRETCLNSGMDAFISKPVSPEQLSHTIEKFYSASPLSK